MLLLSTSSLHGYGLHKIFWFVQQSKYDGVDISVDWDQFDTLDGAYIANLSKEFGVPVLSLSVPQIGVSKKRIDEIQKMAQVLKVQIINFYPPHISDKSLSAFPKYINDLKKNLNIAVTIQNVEQKFMLFVIPEFKHTNLMELKKITGDTALNLSNLDKSGNLSPSKAQDMLGKSLKFVYFSDKQATKTHLLPGNAGGGISHLPLESFLMKLKTSGFGGIFALQVEPKELGVGSDAVVLERLASVKKYFTKYFIKYQPE